MLATQISSADFPALEREYCARSLANFTRRAWPVLEPATSYVDGRHIAAICEHLEAVDRGEIRNLLINIPPRFMKSLLVSVMWPAWRWTNHPATRWLVASYAQQLSVRDALKMRRLIESPWYQSLWGDTYSLTSDQNAKMRFENDATGYRIATATGATATGEGGDIVVVDDPHSAAGADSAAQRETALTWWDETMSTRLNNPRTGAKVIVMQRLHERDLSGHVLEQGGYDHLCLPLEFEPDRRCTTSIGWTDWRTEPGELLWPDRIGPDEQATKFRELGDYAYSGQFQQRPAPRGGGMFPVERFGIVQAVPPGPEVVASVRSWDKAGTAGGGAYTVGVLIHRMRDGSFIVADVVRGQYSALDRERRIRQTADADGASVRVVIEQEPGSGGKESAESTIRNLAGYRVSADRVTGDKVTRAQPYAAQVEGGNVYLIRADWNRAFIDEHETFPNGRYKDQVDAAAGSFASLNQTRRKPMMG